MESPPDSGRPSKRVKIEEATGAEPQDSISVMASKGDNDTKELEVGIFAWIDDNRPVFHGILKKRYTDFLVNEILPDGTTAHLRDTSSRSVNAAAANGAVGDTLDEQSDGKGETLELAESVSRIVATAQHNVSNLPAVQAEPTSQPSDSNPTEHEVSEEDRAQLVGYFSEETVEELILLHKSILRSPNKKSREHATVRTPFTSDRNVRGQIHGAIRRIFASKIESSTDKEGILVLTAAAPSNHRRGGAKFGDKPQPHAARLSWRERGGDYLHFNLYKENKDTMEVISFLSRQLKTNMKTFQFAGTKDRRGVTVQRVSAYRVEAGRLAGLNRSLRFAAVGDFQYENSGLELGELNGNEFVITLRECRIGDNWERLTELERISAAQDYLSRSLEQLRHQGFLNYYGLQRFGSFAIRTDVVGLKILQGDFQGAVEAILQFSPVALEAAKAGDTSTLVGQDDRARAEAIDSWQTTGRCNEALDKLPRKFSAETALIRHLARQRNDYLGGLLSIQRNLRLMYVHAYQSLVFNRAIGERWRLFGQKVVEGDLVLDHEHREKSAHQHPPKQNVDADGEVVIEPAGDDRAHDREDRFERARPLSASEAESGQYSIFDVVLPLPGFDVEYPANALGEWYKTFMASKEGGGLDPHSMRRKQKDFSLSGGYRKAVARIGEAYDVQSYAYNDDNQQFVDTDMDRLKAGHGQDREKVADAVQTHHDGAAESSPSLSKIASVLRFQLGSSQYATIALRELSRGGVQAHKSEFMGGR